MYPELYEYLLQHKQLPIPGIGTFSVRRDGATTNFPDKLMNAPSYSIALNAMETAPSKKFYCWLGSLMQVSDRDAVIRFNDFAFELKKQLEAGDIVNWTGVGMIKKGLAGEIKFVPEVPVSMLAVPAVRVLREKAEHTVRVGEEEKTSAEMVEMLTQQDEKRSYWWAWALAIGLLAVIFLGWHFSEHGMDPSAAANSKKLVPGAATTTYKELP